MWTRQYNRQRKILWKFYYVLYFVCDVKYFNFNFHFLVWSKFPGQILISLEKLKCIDFSRSWQQVKLYKLWFPIYINQYYFWLCNESTTFHFDSFKLLSNYKCKTTLSIPTSPNESFEAQNWTIQNNQIRFTCIFQQNQILILQCKKSKEEFQSKICISYAKNYSTSQ